MSLAAGFKFLKTRPSVLSWKPTGKLQQTVADCVERTGKGLHSGDISTVRIVPEAPRVGRYFSFQSNVIRASIDNALKETPLCTTLSKDGYSVRTVEHLLSALEASGVDNCRIEIEGSGDCDRSVEVPIFDGSAREWVEAIDQAGLKVAVDLDGKSCEKLAPYLNEPVHVTKNDSFLAAFPCSEVNITYGIDFPQAPAIGRQWFSSTLLDESFYSKQIASSRTFCIYEEVEHMRNLGLIKGGSSETAIICSKKELEKCSWRCCASKGLGVVVLSNGAMFHVPRSKRFMEEMIISSLSYGNGRREETDAKIDKVLMRPG
ncbi:UNVERIFIED_CONTAM: putative UDP-3-O-acyl-N-acetylglucosamine deacetylase 1, mitochondrial [Sesamum angustifolium]|uniref:UDP-3-O-acyl-N-acetylglucosamine deacetylase n=1 Tax=Sesamum angustifolium TaxID=2727405 RepID=A0AAW2M5Q0_9LAMI